MRFGKKTLGPKQHVVRGPAETAFAAAGNYPP